MMMNIYLIFDLGPSSLIPMVWNTRKRSENTIAFPAIFEVEFINPEIFSYQRYAWVFYIGQFEQFLMKSVDFMDITSLIIKYLQENYKTQEVVETLERRRSDDTHYINDVYSFHFCLIPVWDSR